MSCIPCPCNFFGITDPHDCADINFVLEQSPTLSQIYTVAYQGVSSSSLVFGGVSEQIQTDLTTLFVRLSFALVIPWAVMFIVLFILLAVRGVITYHTAIMLIILVLFAAFVVIIFVISDTLFIIQNLRTEITNKINSNWKANGAQFSEQLIDAYCICTYCTGGIKGCPPNCGGECGLSAERLIYDQTNDLIRQAAEHGVLTCQTKQQT